MAEASECTCDDMLKEETDKEWAEIDLRLSKLSQAISRLEKHYQLERLRDVYSLFLKAVVWNVGAYLRPPKKDESPSSSDDDVTTAGEVAWSDYWMDIPLDQFTLQLGKLQPDGIEDGHIKQKIGVGVQELEPLFRRCSDEYYVIHNTLHRFLAFKPGKITAAICEFSYCPLNEKFFENAEKDLIESGRGEQDLKALKLLKPLILNTEEIEEQTEESETEESETEESETEESETEESETEDETW